MKVNGYMEKLQRSAALFLFAAMALPLFSCSEKEDLFERYNSAPGVLIREKPSAEWVDSVKAGNALGVPFWLKDEGEIGVKVEVLEGVGIDFWYVHLENGGAVDSLRLQEVTRAGKGRIYPITQGATGLYRGVITVRDGYGVATAIGYQLTVFDNVKPLVRMEVKHVPEYSQYEYEVNLSASVDGDARFGGRITEYEYRIGGYYSLVTPKYNRISHIFPGKGKYTVRCRVKDNNGVWSDWATTEVKVD